MLARLPSGLAEGGGSPRQRLIENVSVERLQERPDLMLDDDAGWSSRHCLPLVDNNDGDGAQLLQEYHMAEIRHL